MKNINKYIKKERLGCFRDKLCCCVTATVTAPSTTEPYWFLLADLDNFIFAFAFPVAFVFLVFISMYLSPLELRLPCTLSNANALIFQGNTKATYLKSSCLCKQQTEIWMNEGQKQHGPNSFGELRAFCTFNCIYSEVTAWGALKDMCTVGLLGSSC